MPRELLIVGIVLAVSAFGGLVWLLLNGISAKGGEKEGDAAKNASQVVAQAQAFRGDSSDGDAWDGDNRLGTDMGDPGGGGA